MGAAGVDIAQEKQIPNLPWPPNIHSMQQRAVHEKSSILICAKRNKAMKMTAKGYGDMIESIIPRLCSASSDIIVRRHGGIITRIVPINLQADREIGKSNVQKTCKRSRR